MPCSYCQITNRLTSSFWSFWSSAAERLSSVLIASIIVGSIASAFYFDIEARKLEKQLNKIADDHQQAEIENRRLRKRNFALWRERARVAQQVARIEAANARTDARVRSLKHKDSVGRAEMAALSGDLKCLRRTLAGASYQRDLYRERLECYLSSAKQALRPVTQ